MLCDVLTAVLFHRMCEHPCVSYFRICTQLCCVTRCVDSCDTGCVDSCVVVHHVQNTADNCVVSHERCVVLQDVLQGVLCYRNSRVSSSVTDSPTSCSQSICRSTTLTRCSVRRTTTCQPPTAASLSMYSGNSTTTSCQTTATMLPPAGG